MNITNEDIIKAFWQQGANNCASIALIKASIGTFGLYKVFSVEDSGEKYSVTLKNGTAITFTKRDLEQSILVGSFQPSKDRTPEKQEVYKLIREYAQLCFAVMVAKYNLDNKLNSFDLALNKLSNGANARFVSQYLGLENYCSEAFRGDAQLPNMIAWQHMPWLKHVVYMSENKYDYYGSVLNNIAKFPKRIQLFDTERPHFLSQENQFSKLNYINVSKYGNFHNTANQHTIPEDVDQIISHIKENGVKRVLLNFHGGLISEEKGMDGAEVFFENYRGLESTLPISIVWETGLFEVLPETFRRIIKTDDLLRSLISKVTKFFAGRFDADLGILENGVVPPTVESEAYILEVSTENYSDEELEAKFSAAYPENRFAELDITAEIYAEMQLITEDEGISETDRERMVKDENEVSHGLMNFGILWYAAKIAKRCVSRFISGRGHGVLPTIIEESFREIYLDDFGSEVWGVMKCQAKAMWNPNKGLTGEDQFAGRYLLDKLAENFSTDELDIDIVAHSAGSIVTCYLIDLIGSEEKYKDFKIKNIIFLAPACRCELFHKTVMKYKNVYHNFKIFTMSDYYESRDKLIQLPVLEYLYTRSLLYLISGILEGRKAEDADALLLGLDRHISKLRPYADIDILNQVTDFLKRNDVKGNLILSISDENAVLGRKTTAMHHGGFGSDKDIVASINYILKQ